MLETADLSFSTPSWAGAASRPLLLSRQPEARHPMETDSVPPGFTRINRKTPEEQNATRYETPADSEKQSIDEELGIQDVTNINEDWYARSESELASAATAFCNNQRKWMRPRKSDRIRCLTRKPLMCWGWTKDQALLSQLLKTGSSICPADSPGLQGMEDQSPDPGPAPPADG